MPRSPEFYDPVRCRSVAVPRVEASRELGPTKPVVHPSAHFVSEGYSAGQPARTPPKKPYRLNSPIWTPAPPAPTAQLSQGVIRPILRTPTVVISTPPISNTRKSSARPSPYAHYHFDLRVARSLLLNDPPLAPRLATPVIETHARCTFRVTKRLREQPIPHLLQRVRAIRMKERCAMQLERGSSGTPAAHMACWSARSRPRMGSSRRARERRSLQQHHVAQFWLRIWQTRQRLQAS